MCVRVRVRMPGKHHVLFTLFDSGKGVCVSFSHYLTVGRVHACMHACICRKQYHPVKQPGALPCAYVVPVVPIVRQQQAGTQRVKEVLHRLLLFSIRRLSRLEACQAHK